MLDDLARRIQRQLDAFAEGDIDTDDFVRFVVKLRTQFDAADVDRTLSEMHAALSDPKHRDLIATALKATGSPLFRETNQVITGGQVGAAVAGDVIGNIYINGLWAPDERKVIGAFLRQIIGKCRALPLQGVHQQTTKTDILSISLKRVYTEAATTALVQREMFLLQHGVTFDAKAYLPVHTGPQLLPRDLRTEVREQTPPDERSNDPYGEWRPFMMSMRTSGGHGLQYADPDALQQHAAAHGIAFYGPQLALSGSHDKTARLWDVETGAQLQRLAGHREFIWKVAFSPDGKYALTASQDKSARLWDVATGVELRRYTGHTNYVVAVAISPDGETIATGGRDKQVQLWNVQSSTILPTFSGHTNDIHWAVFSPDGRYVFTGSLDGTGRLWDAPSGKLVRVLKGHTKTIHTVAFAPDGRSVFTCSFDNTARMWDVETGAEIRQFTDHTGAVYGIAVSSDGQYLATSGDNADPTVRLWNARTGEALRVLEGHTGNVHSLTFSPDNKYVLSGSFDQTARLWDVQTGALVNTFAIPDSAVSVAYSPDGKFIVTGGNDKTARIWNAQTGQEVRSFVGHTDIVKAAVFSPDGAYVLTGSADNTARLWDVNTGQEIRRLSGHTAIVNTVAFSPDGRYMLTGSGDRTARLWHREYQDTIHALCDRLLRDLSRDERAQHNIADDSATCGP